MPQSAHSEKINSPYFTAKPGTPTRSPAYTPSPIQAPDEPHYPSPLGTPQLQLFPQISRTYRPSSPLPYSPLARPSSRRTIYPPRISTTPPTQRQLDVTGSVIEHYESYYGSVTTFRDAILIIEAARTGKTNRIRSRRDIPKEFLRSGSVLVWNESECDIRRWTGLNCYSIVLAWSASRVSGQFLCYKEIYRPNSANDHIFQPPPPGAKPGKILPNGFCKKTITVLASFSGVKYEKWTLCCYYRSQDVGPNGFLKPPQEWAKRIGITEIPRNLYPKWDEYVEKEARKNGNSAKMESLSTSFGDPSESSGHSFSDDIPQDAEQCSARNCNMDCDVTESQSNSSSANSPMTSSFAISPVGVTSPVSSSFIRLPPISEMCAFQHSRFGEDERQIQLLNHHSRWFV
ncbi:Gti1/Pac2 family-domain-containing protein [Paraphysoderma sedebokerense]|nr:Gti1/Pac2 family-domain-containing protein [Paraphysoderma sedebokerense]